MPMSHTGLEAGCIQPRRLLGKEANVMALQAVLQAVPSPLLPSTCAYQDPQAQIPGKGGREAAREPPFTHKACWEAEGRDYLAHKKLTF